MRRPLILSTALATALAAELAVGALLVAPTALADEIPAPGEDPTAPTGEEPIRTGRTDDAPPAPAAPVDVPEAPAPTVRSGRVGELPAPDAAPVVDDATAEEPDAPATPGEPATHGDPAAGRQPGSDPGPRTRQSGGQETGGPTRAPEPPSTSAPGSPGTAPDPGSGTAPGSPVPALPLARTVVPGDNLWEIAAAHLAAASGRQRGELGALDIAPYWTQVCMVNRQHLVSGDVGLIYAGEVIELPAP
jgi:hypothetical protein